MASSSNRTILQPRSRLSGQQQQSAGSSSRTPSYAQQSYRPSIPYFHERSLEDQHRINTAVHFAEENELLIWSSLSRNESLPQTKMHWQREMLLIDSDVEADLDRMENGDEEGSGSSGSIEWHEDIAQTSEDDARMKPGIKYGPTGWWDPRKHSSAEERLREEAEIRRQREQHAALAKVKVEDEEMADVRSPKRGSPRSGGKKPSGSGRRSGSGSGSGSGTPRRKSGGKRAFGAGNGSGSSA